MAEYSAEFKPPVSFTREGKELIDGMTSFGWMFRLSSKGHAIGRAPAPSKETVSVSRSAGSTNRGLQNAEAVFKRWLREHASQEVPDGIAALEASYKESPLVTAVIRNGVARHVDQNQRARDMMAIVEDFIDGAAEVVAEAMAESGSTAEVTKVSSSGERSFTLSPWYAKKHPGRKGGERYQSSGVMERRWSDGTTDYVCSVAGCEFTNENPRSVSSHYGSGHTAKGEGTRYQDALKNTVPDMAYTESEHRAYNPTDRLIATLATHLKEQGPLLFDLTYEELAVMFLTWAHDRPDLDEVVQSPTREWSAEEIVSRVRLLVGQPLAVKVESLEEERTRLYQELAQRTQERDAMTAELLRAQNDVDTLVELAESIRHKKAVVK